MFFFSYRYYLVFLTLFLPYLFCFHSLSFPLFCRFISCLISGARGSVVGWGTVLQAGRSRVRFSMTSLDFYNWPNPSSRPMAVGSTQPLTEMSTRNLPGGKMRPARKADNLTAICESIV
jgi:hypothetical protein